MLQSCPLDFVIEGEYTRVHMRTFLESKMLKDFCLSLLYNLFSSHQKFGKKEVAK